MRTTALTETAASAANNTPPHLSGVRRALSISLSDLGALDEPAHAVPGKKISGQVLSAQTLSGSPTESVLAASSPPNSEPEWTPDAESAPIAPWSSSHAVNASVVKASAAVPGTTVPVARALSGAEDDATSAPAAADDDDADDDADDAAKADGSAPKSSVKKMAWTSEEDAKLLELVEKHGPSNWSRIAADLPSRIGKQCRERWHNHLSPAVKKEGFSAEEDQAIMEAVAEHGTKWAHIVKLIPGRTDNAIKNRWNSTTRKMLRVQRRAGDAIPGLGDVDLGAMDAAALAKHLLAHSITAATAAPPKPTAKRRLSLAKENKEAEEEEDDAPKSKKRRRKAGAEDVADGVALLRAATFRAATNALMEAAAAADVAEEVCGGGEGGEGAEEWERSSESDDGRGNFTVDALTLLAESSSEAAACRSPRMLEAAIALGGALGF